MKILEIEHPPPLEALIERVGRCRLPFVLDSAQRNDGLGDWSFLGAEPFAVVDKGGLEAVREALSPYRTERHGTIPFTGGAVGFLSYDYGRRIERIPAEAVDDRGIPDLHFGLYDGIAAYEHASGRLFLIAHGIRENAAAAIEAVRAIALTGVSRSETDCRAGDWTWNLSAEAFRHAVGRVRDYIASGDLYQVNLSRRARCPFEGDPLQLYQALRKGNPAPYGAYLDCGALQVFSTSPEQFLRKRGRELVTRPIKGTRPRGADAEGDRVQAESLRQSAKDRAELLMIVDLERNDLGRVAEYGSVRVEGLYQLEHYARVIHQTARVKARLGEGRDIVDAIHALFPGGSITGAPKVRAMEIIEELEPTRRGVYCGSIGYLGFDGDAELNIAIRSLHLKDGQLDYQVGGGIVWDSEPEAEYLETLDKGRAIRETIDALCRT